MSILQFTAYIHILRGEFRDKSLTEVVYEKHPPILIHFNIYLNSNVRKFLITTTKTYLNNVRLRPQSF